MSVVAPAELVKPHYDGPCIAGLVPALLRRGSAGADWLPDPVTAARQVVLLVVDGLGWEQLAARHGLAPQLASMTGGPVTSVVPTTTATALTSITTGLPPAGHGVLGYRLHSPGGGVLNVLLWQVDGQDARTSLPPSDYQPRPALAGADAVVVTRAEFHGSGFTAAHLAGPRIRGWATPSGIVVETSAALKAGHGLVYVYYDGLDRVSHRHGLDDHFDAEMSFVDRLAGDLCSVLPRDAALLVTADHGQVHVGDAVLSLPEDVFPDLTLMSGEGRFRWLHCRPGTAERVAALVEDALGDAVWVCPVEVLVDGGWFGGPVSGRWRERLGDVAVIARGPVTIADPSDRMDRTMVGRHGALTPAEMWVPLLGWSPGP